MPEANAPAPGLHPMGKGLTLMALAVLALPGAAAVEPWREEPAVAALFRQAGVEGTFVLLDERRGELRGHNQSRAEQRFSPASTFKIANALIGLSLGAVRSVDELSPPPGMPTLSCASGCSRWDCAAP